VIRYPSSESKFSDFHNRDMRERFRDFDHILIGSISRNIRFTTRCRIEGSRIARRLMLGIVMVWRAGLAKLLIQCSNEKRQLVEGSYGKKWAQRDRTESYHFPCPRVLLRSHNAHPSRDSRPSGQGQFATFSLSELSLRMQDR
jgi:hypothetical protein